jgi:hypothetical protein
LGKIPCVLAGKNQYVANIKSIPPVEEEFSGFASVPAEQRK